MFFPTREDRGAYLKMIFFFLNQNALDGYFEQPKINDKKIFAILLNKFVFQDLYNISGSSSCIH